MFCETCKQKMIIIDSSVKTIWGFNPYIFDNYKSLKEGFKIFYKNIGNIEDNFYNSYNEEGYTYSQWYVYIISKNYHKYKNLKKQTLWLFQTLSGYDFFKKMISLGKRDDTKHNTLHHFLKYLDNMGIQQNNMLKILLDNDLKMEDEDEQEISGHDYLINKMILGNDLELTKNLTKQYKTEENIVFSHEIFKDQSFIRCESCNNFIDIYQDMLKNKSIIKSFNDLVEKFEYIIKKRQDCIKIYKKYEKCKDSTERHQYVVDIYKSIFY